MRKDNSQIMRLLLSRGFGISQIGVLGVCLLTVVAFLFRAASRGMDWEPQAEEFLYKICATLVSGIILKRISRESPLPSYRGKKKIQTYGGAKGRLLRVSMIFLFTVLTGITVWSAIRISIDSLVASIRITKVPPSGEGGTDKRTEICGIVTGVNPREYRVVLFAEANLWYLQPDTGAYMTGIQAGVGAIQPIWDTPTPRC